MNPARIPIRVVFYQEGGELLAHCLEFDLIGVGKDHREAFDDLFNAIATQVHATDKFNSPANLFTSAPAEIVQKFAEGHDVFQGELEVGEKWVRTIDNVTLQGVEVREYRNESALAT